jgi:hypothetical protein
MSLLEGNSIHKSKSICMSFEKHRKGNVKGKQDRKEIIPGGGGVLFVSLFCLVLLFNLGYIS